jgi:ABC-2 type transport system ATP-binding protein
MDNAERLCDAVCIIARGEVVLDGPLGEVKARQGGRHVALSIEANNGSVSRIFADPALVRRVNDSNRYLEVELAEGADPQELLRRVVAAGALVNRFELIQPSLHQIFLDRVGATGVEEGMSGHG